jgi:hypothetical protein
MALAPQPASLPRSMPRETHVVVIVDEKNMLLLWLEEMIAQRKIGVPEANEMVRNQETQGKLWTGPFKDGLGSAQILRKLGQDFASWKGAQVLFIKSRAGNDLVVFKGWPAGRKLITGTRYRLDNPKIMEMQIGKPGIRAAAKESARFGVYLVVAVDIADYLLRDNATLGQLLGSLTIDIPSVLLASACGAVAGAAISGTTVAGLATIGALAVGPLLVAFAVGIAVGYGLYLLDDHFHMTDRLSQAYDNGLVKLSHVWHELGQEAQERYTQLTHSRLVHDLRQDTDILAQKIARQSDRVRGELARLW